MSFHRLLSQRKRELPCILAYLALIGVMSFAAPRFFNGQNLRDVAVNTAPTLIVIIGMTIVILAGEIDISVGSAFAVCSVLVGTLAKSGIPIWALPLCAIIAGGTLGAFNGWLVGRLRLPSIIVTLATFVGWRDALQWITQGAWVQNLPSNFQWFGLEQHSGERLIVITALFLLVIFGFALRHISAGRSVYAVGSDKEAARLAGIEPRNIVFAAFTIMGALTGIAALLNATRFSSVPSNLGTGLELKSIAAVVVGGTAITGGRGTILGSLFGAALLGSIGTALVFAGIDPFWEKAIQGSIILIAVFADAALSKVHRHVNLQFSSAGSAIG